MKNKLIIVDVESDGPLDGKHSMVCFGAVILDEKLDKTFYGQTKPIVETYNPEALSISGFTREQHENFSEPKQVMEDFKKWIESHLKPNEKPIFISDNNGYDFGWINYYFHHYLGANPFGWSSRRIGDLFCGFYKDTRYQWKKHKLTKHDHNPKNDAIGMGEALLYLHKQGLKLF